MVMKQISHITIIPNRLAGDDFFLPNIRAV